MKLLITLSILLTFLLSINEASGAQEDVDKLLTMDEVARGEFVLQMHKKVNDALELPFRSLICCAAKNAQFNTFQQAVDMVKSMLEAPFVLNLTYAEAAFYIDCDDDRNPFYINIHPEYINMPADGLADSTLSLIRILGPFLLVKGPDGMTALEHVEERLRISGRVSSEKVQGVYAKIKSRIEIEIHYMNQAKSTN